MPGLPVRCRSRCFASSIVEVLLKVKGTSFRIFHERLSMMYSWSLSSALFLGIGIENFIGFFSFLPRGL